MLIVVSLCQIGTQQIYLAMLLKKFCQIFPKTFTATLTIQSLKVANLRALSNQDSILCTNGLSKPMIGRPRFGQTKSLVLLMSGLAAPLHSGIQKHGNVLVVGPTDYP